MHFCMGTRGERMIAHWVCVAEPLSPPPAAMGLSQQCRTAQLLLCELQERSTQPGPLPTDVAAEGGRPEQGWRRE